MLALMLLALVPVLMWLGQTVMLRHYGLPVRYRIDAGDAPRPVRTVGRFITQASLVGVIVAYPLARGQPVTSYYATLLPASGSALHLLHGAAAAVLFLSVLQVAWLMSGRLDVLIHHSQRRWVRRLVLLLPTALFGALVEELLFRGVVLADLLRSLPGSETAAIAIAVCVFAGAHYVRSVKRYWTLGGHVMLGILLCVAFLQTRTLWLAIGLHAGGILMIMGTRPFFWNRGPAWITGASVYPYAGAVGIAGLGLLTAFVATYYGG